MPSLWVVFLFPFHLALGGVQGVYPVSRRVDKGTCGTGKLERFTDLCHGSRLTCYSICLLRVGTERKRTGRPSYTSTWESRNSITMTSDTSPSACFMSVN
ncbi:hypothetical protein F5Y18DRAFT_96705 [Xylariaceae sp. FL1019]|nr:hypothetical protein F5Y18DRAFT_96705 [Xylariaceae sp. FL1019]